MKEYGEWAMGRGLRASTAEHPKDLVVRTPDAEWLIEAEVIKRGNATQAVREAIGQLFEYRRFLYADSPIDPTLVALFSELIGDAYLGLLQELELEAVWRDGGTWKGTPLAVSGGLAEERGPRETRPGAGPLRR